MVENLFPEIGLDSVLYRYIEGLKWIWSGSSQNRARGGTRPGVSLLNTTCVRHSYIILEPEIRRDFQQTKKDMKLYKWEDVSDIVVCFVLTGNLVKWQSEYVEQFWEDSLLSKFHFTKFFVFEYFKLIYIRWIPVLDPI